MRLLMIPFLLIFLCQCTHFPGKITQDEEGIPVVFTFVDPQAKKVCLGGSFNQWSPQAHCMKKEKGVWTLSLSLPPGRYPYLFLVNDQVWKLDPGVTLTEENGFGSKNSVLIVESSVTKQD
jgi:1,4-alpha-glucan branching enzyme